MSRKTEYPPFTYQGGRMYLAFPSRRNRALWIGAMAALVLLIGWGIGTWVTTGHCTIEIAQTHPAADALIDAALDGRTDCTVITHP